MTKHILIIGGTSGLGHDLALKYAALGHTVTITGRTNPNRGNVRFVPFEVGADVNMLRDAVATLVEGVEPIHTLVYAAGFYQEGTVVDLSEEDIFTMVNVGLLAPMLLVQAFIPKAVAPFKVVFITSSSQVTPRENEPIYTAVKAGLGMFGNSLGLDMKLGKVVVVAPSGMKTPFWDETKDTSSFLEPAWVADQIIELSGGSFKYKFAKILRDPARVEIVETRV